MAILIISLQTEFKGCLSICLSVRLSVDIILATHVGQIGAWIFMNICTLIITMCVSIG